jgi:DNA-binding SARP family transcriptional activator
MLRREKATVRHQERKTSRWVGSVLGLVGLVVGLPLALVILHVTPPLAQLGHVALHPGGVGDRLGGSLTDSEVVKSVACAAWIAWLWLVVCVVTEVVGVFRGRPSLHLPGSRHIQPLISTLVGASLAVLPIAKDGLPMRLAAAPAAIHAPVAKILLVSDDETMNESMAEVADVIYVVRPGDTLWSIAENQLGSPLLWPGIAQLNYGRIQPDGDRLTDAHWIFPGWELALPLPSSAGVSPGGSGTQTGLPSAALSNSVRPTIAVPRVPQSSSHVPSAFESGAAVPPVRSIGGQMATLGKTETSMSKHEGQPPSPVPSPIPLGEIAYGVLGAGVIALLERLRRVQRRHRPNGLRIALPDGDLAALERRLRVDADPEGVDFIDLGLRALVANSLRGGMMPPQVTVVRLGEHALEIMLDESDASREPRLPFVADPGAQKWFLERNNTTLQALQSDPDVEQMDAPYPALVTIGRDEFGVVMVDLERAGSVDVTGINAGGLLGTIAVELATAKWADQVDLILVGCDQELEALERVTHVPGIADILAKAQRRVRERHALLQSVGRRANLEIRWTEGGDAWDLCVVMCAAGTVSADREGAKELVRLAGDGGMGLAVVLGADTGEASWHLGAHEERIEVTSNGSGTSTFGSRPVDSGLPTGVASLVAIAGQLEGVGPWDPPYDQLDAVAPSSDPLITDGLSDARLERASGTSAMYEVSLPDRQDSTVVKDVEESDQSFEIEVRVLGPVEIVGAARPFTRAWAVELIVYLAMHRTGASSERWATALWPDRIMAAASLHSTASAARRSLGVSLSGEDHLPRAHGRLSLGPSVGSDWNRFVELSERLDPESWRKALELIRGRPFEGLRAPDWVLLEGIAANVEAVVVDLASRYAEHCLSVGDPGGAEWSARQGLRASAYDERLYRILLRAAEAAGNPAGVESVMAELVRLVADDVEPYDAVHPETLELYRSLTRRSTPLANR